MTGYTRLTIVGSRRRAEMVVPNDEAVGSLIPRLMELLDERAGSVARPLTLVRSTGEQLDSSLTPGEQSLYDGELLRLLRDDATPPPPEVSDVTDVLAESRDERAGLWQEGSRRATAAVSLGVSGAAAGLLLERIPGIPLGWTLFAAYAVAVIVALASGLAGGRWLSVAATSLAVGLALPVSLAVLSGLPRGLPDPVRVIAAFAVLGWAALAVGVGAGLGRRPAWWGGVLGALLPLLLLLLPLTGLGAAASEGVVAVLAAVVCGLLPWYAMSASGLTGLDDQVVEGRLRRRDAILTSVTTAYRTLTWATFAVAVPFALTAAALLASSDLWAVGLGAAVVVLTAARTRALPLAVQGFALWAAAGGSAVAGLLAQPALDPELGVAVLAVGVVVAVVAGAARPPEHRRASFRRIANVVEAVVVAAMLPLLAGVFGLYAELLGAFG